MKKFYKPLCLIAAIAAMSLTSCQKETLKPAEEGTTTLTVHATVEDVANATKTYIDGTQVYWDTDEQMKVVNLETYDEYNSDGFTASDNNTHGVFTFTVKETEASRYAGIYPADAGIKKNQEGYRIDLPATQFPTANSYDPDAYILITEAETIDLTTEQEWVATYYRATALNNFQLTNLNDDITSVKITFPDNYEYTNSAGETITVHPAGSRYFDLETGTPQRVFANGSSTITLQYAEALSANTKNIWFTTWGVELKQGDKITIEASSKTTKYTKTLTANEAKSLKEGWLNIVPINMEGAETESISQEDFSGEYLIVAEGSDYWACMTNVNTKDYFGYVYNESIASSENFESLSAANFYSLPDIEQYVWVIQKNDEGYTIQNKANKEIYVELRNTTGNNAYISSESFPLSIRSDDGILKIQNPDNAANGDSNNDYRWLQFNANSPRFANYKSGQKNIHLLPWVESTEPMLSVTEPSKTVSADAESVSFTYVARNLNGEVKANITEGNNTVISAVVVNKETSTVDVTLIPNETENSRTATITLSAEGVDPVTLTITQNAKSVGAVVDILTADAFNAGSSYGNVSCSAPSGAEYAGNMMKNNNNSIQLRSSNSNAGIITKVSAGKVTKIEVTWDSETTDGRVLNVYGSNTAYEGEDASELYKDSTSGELIGTIQKGTTEFNVEGDYQYIGLRSKSGALYLEEIKITWE